MRSLWFFAAVVIVSLGATNPASANPTLWLAPPDTVTQPQSTDFSGFFERPASWTTAASHVRIFSVPINYLSISQPGVAKRFLQRIAASGLKLDVGISAMQVNKNLCGDGVEGMIWPGEVVLFAKKLKELGADVASFSFDLPLNSGYIYTGPKACRLSIAETARRLADTVRTLRAYYPNAKMFDAEVPTGMPVTRWSAILEEWLTDYKNAAGSDLDGLSMDVWYHDNWQSAVRATTKILAKHGIQAGVIMDASEGPRLTPAAWIGETKRIACQLDALRLPLDFIVIANWLDLRVPNLPENDPNTLTGFVDWLARPNHCRELPH